MKKTKAALLLLIAALSLSACNSTASSNSTEATTEEETKEKDSKETTDEEETDDEEETTSKKGASSKKSEDPDQTKEVDDSDIVEIEEQVIYDENDVKITVTGFDQDQYDVWLSVLLENNSGENIEVQTRNETVNSYMSSFIFSSEVAANKKSKDKIIIDTTYFERCGIEKVKDIEFSLLILNDNFDTIAESEPIHIERHLAEPYEQEYDDSGEVLLDENNIKIVAKDLQTDDYGRLCQYLYIENNSEKSFTVQVRNVSINGFMADPFMSVDVMPGKVAIDEMSFYMTELAEYDIETVEDVENIELSLHIFDSSSYDSLVDTDPIVLEFN